MVFEAVGLESAVFSPLLSGATCVNIQFLKARFLPSFSSSPGLLIAELQLIFIPIFHSIQVQSIEEDGRQHPGLGTLIISKRSISPILSDGCSLYRVCICSVHRYHVPLSQGPTAPRLCTPSENGNELTKTRKSDFDDGLDSTMPRREAVKKKTKAERLAIFFSFLFFLKLKITIF
ncbi:hypothetical protein I7I53_11231 [Histoplasma capsulatum var. duboisii H88]|uniref:Uncharacterized protein n=1 Tax=Ajellomyces capsulatus (strain H88) TaxID=544711 RepID=A0A8A1LEU0_AJEC8|nr:hypothetical protein I7I53_11231 [Histoplasma capsulatum var. duboisii H88]